MRCQCLTKQGIQCKNNGSMKVGSNPNYCWQHQHCQLSIIRKHKPLLERDYLNQIETFKVLPKDLVRKILLDVDDVTLTKMCKVESYVRDICNEELFWRLRMHQKYPNFTCSDHCKLRYKKLATTRYPKVDFSNKNITPRMRNKLYSWLLEVKIERGINNSMLIPDTMFLLDLYLHKHDLVKEKLQLYGFLCFRFAYNRWNPAVKDHITYDLMRTYMDTDVQTLPNDIIKADEQTLIKGLPTGTVKLYDGLQYRMTYAATYYSPIYRMFDPVIYKQMVKTGKPNSLFDAKIGFLHIMLATSSIFGLNTDDIVSICTIAANNFLGLHVSPYLIKPTFQKVTTSMKQILPLIRDKQYYEGLRDYLTELFGGFLVDKLINALS